MNVLSIFEQRIGAIFEEGAPGHRKPFSFKRLAKRAVREMEDETFVIDGVDTAPALYTVLVSAKDDVVMRPMYVQICDEMSQLVEAQAKKRGYTFVGRPLVRFMVDPALRGGRFSVFAENIDPRTLARLRDEENAYLGITGPSGSFMEQGVVPQPVPIHEEEPAPIASEVAFAEEDASEVVPVVPLATAEPFLEEEGVADEGEADDANTEEPLAEKPAADEDDQGIEAEASIDAPEEEPAFEDEPAVEDDSEPVQEELASEPEPTPVEADDVTPVPAPTPEPARPASNVCTLFDLKTGQVYSVVSQSAVIGRERTTGGIVLHDPNASRRHAELSYDGMLWHVRDLNSTNGTLVNDMDVREAALRDGDVLTIGLTTLRFRVG